MSINYNNTNLVTYTKLIDVSDSGGANAVDDIFIVDPARGPFYGTDMAFYSVSATSFVGITATVGIRTVGTNTVAGTFLNQFALTAWSAAGQWYWPIRSTSTNLPAQAAAGSTISFKNSAASNGTSVKITVIIQGYYLNP